MSANPGRCRPWNTSAVVKRVAFTAVLAALVIAAMELLAAAALRWAVREDTRRALARLADADDRAPRFVPNTFWHHDLNPAHPRYSTALNTKGTLGPDFEVPKPAGELRVICLGDSTVKGLGVRPEQAFPAVLERLLAADVAGSRYRSVRVLNAGISSHNSAFNLAYLALRLIHFQPDMLVLKSSYNDYVPFIVRGMGVDYTHVYPRPFRLPVHRQYWTMARHSRTLRLLGLALYAADLQESLGEFYGSFDLGDIERFDYEQHRDKLYIYAENVRSMIVLARSRGARVAVLDLPTSPHGGHFAPALKARYRALFALLEGEARRVAGEESVPFVQTGPMLARHFLDHCHNTPSGHRWIAERLRPVVVSELGLPGGSPAPVSP